VNPGETLTVEKTLSEVSVNDCDVLIVPGGSVGADNLQGAHCSCAAGERVLV